jgi:uncharacterized membrane protein YeaQ/YmgE (transglycosylase-associated protein family)
MGTAMGLLAWILVGLLAGWIASRVVGSRRGLIGKLVIGLIGSLIGGFIFSKLNVAVVPDFWGALITATVGAVVFLLVWQGIRRD